MNRYDPIEHRYWIGDLEVPSVTRLLPKKNFFMPAEQLEEYRKEGEESHDLIKMYFQTVYPDRYTGKNRMLMALDRWMEKDEYKLGKLVVCEKPLFSELNLFAGTPDVIFDNVIIDFKRSRVVKKDIALQLAGYWLLALENKIMQKNGAWLMMWYDEFKDEYKASECYREDATQTFLLYVAKYHIDQQINNYHAR